MLKTLGCGAAAVAAGDFLGGAVSNAVPMVNVGGMPVAKYLAAVGGAWVGRKFLLGSGGLMPAVIFGVVCMAGADLKTSFLPSFSIGVAGWDITRPLAGAALAIGLKHLGVGVAVSG